MDKQSFDKKCFFLGAAVDEVNGPSDPRVQVALDHSASLLTIHEFAGVTKIDLDLNIQQKVRDMTPDAISQAMMLNTEEGNAVCNYYLNIEELAHLYAEYSAYFNARRAKQNV